MEGIFSASYIQSILTPVGFGAIFVWIWWLERSSRNEAQRKLDEKNDQIIKVAIEFRESTDKQTEATNKLNETLNTNMDLTKMVITAMGCTPRA